MQTIQIQTMQDNQQDSISFIKENTLYLSLFFLLWSVAVMYLFNGGLRGDVIQFFGRHRSDYTNIFFVFSTYLGEGYVYVMAIIAFLFVQYSKSIAFIINALLVLAVSGTLKWLFGHERPVRYFNDLVQAPELPNYLPDVALHQGWTTSFPSGHTTSAFAFFSLLAFFLPQKAAKLLCLVVAVLVALSRMYMVQHFLKDIASGMITGLFIAVSVFYIHQKIAPKWSGRLTLKN